MSMCSCLCGFPPLFFLFWHCLSTAMVKPPGISRQYSGEPCQEQFGASAEISSCRGAVMEGKSKTLTWLAGLPPSWKESLVTWPDFTHFSENHSRRCRCAIWRNIILTPGTGVYLCHIAYAIELRQSFCQKEWTNVIYTGGSAGPYQQVQQLSCTSDAWGLRPPGVPSPLWLSIFHTVL